MSTERSPRLDDRLQRAIEELQAAILARYPGTTFTVSHAPDDAASIHLNAFADLDDPDEVADLVLDRLLELQVEEGIPLHVIPLQTTERAAAAWAAERAARSTRSRRLRLSDWYPLP